MRTTNDSRQRELANELVSRAETHTRPTLEQIHVVLAPEVRNWILTRAGPSLRAAEDIDDVTQEVWLRVAQSYARFDPRRGALRSWVFGVTQHTLCDLLRKLRPTPMNLDDPELLELAAAAAPCQGSTGRLLEELATFSSADRDLVRICALEGRSTCEAARELAISSAAARKRWSRLRSRLARRTDLAARSG